MADQKITDLTDYTPAIDTDIMPIVDVTADATKKITWANVKATLKTYFDGIYSDIASPTFTGNVTLPVGGHPLNGYFNLVSPASDHTVVGVATNAFQSGATIAQSNIVYMGSSSKWLIADSDAIATSGGLIGIALEAKNDTQAMLVALPGSFVRDDTWTWTIGAALYVGETAGAIQATIPTGADGVIRVIGFAVSATVIFFNPSSDNSTVVA